MKHLTFRGLLIAAAGCGALCAYVKNAWPEYQSEPPIPPGKVLKHVSIDEDGLVFKAVQFSNSLYIIEWRTSR